MTLHQSVVDFWDVHGIWFAFGLFMFPRLTMLIGSLAGFCYSGGLLFWFGWLIVPRFTIAIIATLSYWNTNPILVLFTWMLCITGESAEKKTVVRFS